MSVKITSQIYNSPTTVETVIDADYCYSKAVEILEGRSQIPSSYTMSGNSVTPLEYAKEWRLLGAELGWRIEAVEENVQKVVPNGN